jgi:hypothetical protein
VRKVVAGSRATNSLREQFGDALWIVQNPELERLLFDRNLIGIQFGEVCREASTRLLLHLQDELESEESVAELLILSKGMAFQVSAAYASVFGDALPVNLVATQRQAVSARDATIVTSYSRVETPAEALVVADIVASGATMCSALETYTRKYRLKTLFLLSFAGTIVGAQRIRAYCAERNIRLRLLYGLAAFGLGDDGFDLSFLHPETVCEDEYRRRASLQFGGRPVSAVGWDFGAQLLAPGKYRELCWMEAEYWGLHGHPALSLEREPRDLARLAGEAAAFRRARPASDWRSSESDSTSDEIGGATPHG